LQLSPILTYVHCKILAKKDNYFTLQKINYNGLDLLIQQFNNCTIFTNIFKNLPSINISENKKWDSLSDKFIKDITYTNSPDTFMINLNEDGSAKIEVNFLDISANLIVSTAWFENLKFNIEDTANYEQTGYFLIGFPEFFESYKNIEFLFPNLSSDGKIYKFEDFCTFENTNTKNENNTIVEISNLVVQNNHGYTVLEQKISNYSTDQKLQKTNFKINDQNFEENDLTNVPYTFNRYNDSDVAVVKIYLKDTVNNNFLVVTKTISLGIYDIKAYLISEYDNYRYSTLDQLDKIYPWDAVTAFVDVGSGVQVYKLRWWVEYTNGISSVGGEELEYTVIDNSPKEIEWGNNTVAGVGIAETSENIKILKLQQLNSSQFILNSYFVKYINKNWLPDSDEAGFDYYLNILVEHSQGISIKKLKIPKKSVFFTNEFLWYEKDEAVAADKLLMNYNNYNIFVQIFKNDFSNLSVANHFAVQINSPYYFYENDYFYINYGNNNFAIHFKKAPLSPGKYVAFIRLVVYDGTNHLQFAEFYPFTIKIPQIDITLNEDIPLKEACIPAMPKLQNEVIKYISPHVLTSCEQELPYTMGGNWFQYEFTDDICIDNIYESLQNVDKIPDEYVDIILYFNNRINDQYVNGIHKFRVKGKIAILDDEITEERYVDTNYNEPSIIRTFKDKIELTLFCENQLQLNSINLIKYAHHVALYRRVGIIRNFFNFIFENIKITDAVDKLVITITLRSLHYRNEFRY